MNRHHPDPPSHLGGEPNKSTKGQKPLWPWLLFGCLTLTAIIGVVVVAVPIVIFKRWDREGERRLAEEMRLLEQSSDPITPQDLEQYYSNVAGDSASIRLWLGPPEVFSSREFATDARGLPRVDASATREEIPVPGEPWALLDDSRTLLTKYRAQIEQLHQAAEKSAPARYPTRFEEGFSMEVDELEKVRRAHRVLVLDAYVQAHDRDASGALHAIRTSLRLSDSLAGYPNTTASLVRIAIATGTYDLIADLLPHLDLPDADLQELGREVSNQNFDEGLRHAFIGERVIGLMVFDNPETAAEEFGSDMDATKLRAVRRWMKRDRAFYLTQIREALEASEAPWPQKIKLARDINGNIEQVVQQGKLAQLQHLFSMLLLPAHEAIFNATGRAVALRNATEVAIALERYRRARGSFPQDLSSIPSDFLAKVPMDPFDGQPLRYRVEQQRAIVFSVGDNGKNDGGNPNQETVLDYVVSLSSPVQASPVQASPVQASPVQASPVRN